MANLHAVLTLVRRLGAIKRLPSPQFRQRGSLIHLLSLQLLNSVWSYVCVREQVKSWGSKLMNVKELVLLVSDASAVMMFNTCHGRHLITLFVSYGLRTVNRIVVRNPQDF
jgi:hypothetical protein